MKKIMTLCHSVIILMVMIAGIQKAEAESLTTDTIVEAVLQAALTPESRCLRYQPPTQFCVWFSVAHGKTFTPVLNHYLPDVVVTVYRNRDENPWVEARTVFDLPAGTGREQIIKNIGSGNHALLHAHEQHVIFKEADVIGDPALLVLPHFLGFLLLPSTAVSFQPYFQSIADSILWRGLMPAALPEETSSLVLAPLHPIGTGLTNWGSVYPHEGSVIGMDDAKASMVIAQRAADILTNPAMIAHLHQPLSTACGQHCTASAIEENSQETLFQPIYPNQKMHCAPFGSDASYDAAMLNEKGAYVWVVWRHYQGCTNGQGQFMGVI